MRGTSRCVSSRKLWFTSAVGAVTALALAGTAWSGEGPKKDDPFKKDEVFKVTHVLQVPGATIFSFDISWYDPVLNRYYLADRNNKAIDVINPSAPNSITQFFAAFAGVNSGGNDFSGPDGVATVNNHTEIWVGDSPGKVWVLKSSDGTVKTLPGGAANPISIKTSYATPPVTSTSRADEFCTDTKDNLVMITSPAEGPPAVGGFFVTFISTTTYKPVGQLIFDGAATPPVIVNGVKVAHAPLNATNGLEQCGWSAKTGLFYQNVPEVSGSGHDTSDGAIAVIDPKTMLVIKSFKIPIGDCAGPQGMAIGPDDQILEGCNAASPDSSGGTAGTSGTGHRNIVVVDINGGGVLKTFKDLGGADEVWFNPGDGHYVIPSCNTPCRTVGALGGEGPESLGFIDSNGLRLDHAVTVGFPNGATLITGGNRNVHSAAASSENNAIILPIPATGGTAPQYDPTLCDSFGQGITRVGSPSAATGCIVILATKKDDKPNGGHEGDHEGDDDGHHHEDDGHHHEHEE